MTLSRVTRRKTSCDEAAHLSPDDVHRDESRATPRDADLFVQGCR